MAPVAVLGVATASDLAKTNTSDSTLFVSSAGNDSNDGRSWRTAKATVAAAITALPSGGCIEVAGQHTVASPWPEPADHTLIRGQGSRTRITYSGTAPLVTLTGSRQVHFEALRVSLTDPAGRAFRLDNTFRCSWNRCLIDGGHTGATGSTYHGQVGFEFRGNAGDNRIVNCDLNNLGEAIQTDTIMNYLIGSTVGNCWTGVHVDDGDHTGGMSIANSTFVGTAIGASAVRAHVLIDVPANHTWIAGSWFEGCTTAVQAGTNTGTPEGPFGMSIVNTRLAATGTCLDIRAGRQFRLDSVRFAPDRVPVVATPVELVIDAANAVDGFASNLLSEAGFDLPRSTFPDTWTYLPRYAQDFQIPASGGLLYSEAGALKWRGSTDTITTIAPA